MGNPKKADVKQKLCAKRLKNLRPFVKGDPSIPKSPGRPRSREFARFVREFYEDNPDPKNMLRLLRAMEKKCPGELAHYLAGKPVTQIELTGKDGGPVSVEHMSAEELRMDMIKRGELDPQGRLIQRN